MAYLFLKTSIFRRSRKFPLVFTTGQMLILGLYGTMLLLFLLGLLHLVIYKEVDKKSK